MKRFCVMRLSDVSEKLLGYPDDDLRGALVECSGSGEPIRLLGTDGGEPEDNSFGRDWRCVVDELNKLAEAKQ